LTGWPVTVNISNLTPANNSRFNDSTRDIWVLANVSATINATLVVDGVYNDSYNITPLCYQEFANVSTSCGGLSTGRYGPITDWATPFIPPDIPNSTTNLTDGDYTTYAGSSLYSEYVVNYTVPIGAIIPSKWQIGSSTVVAAPTATLFNLTLNSTCLYGNNLVLNVTSITIPARLWYYCLNSTGGWTQLYFEAKSYLYDEAIYWNFTNNVSFTKSFNEGWHNVSMNFTDGLYSTNTSTNWFLYTTSPVIDHIEMHPTYPNTSSQLDCHTQYMDPNPAHTMNASVTWWSSTNNVTWTNVNTYDYTFVGTSGTVEITTDLGTGSWGGVPIDYNYYKCQVFITDGITNSSTNTSSKGIFPLHNLTIYSPPNNTASLLNMNGVNNITFSVTDWDGGIQCRANINGTFISDQTFLVAENFECPNGAGSATCEGWNISQSGWFNFTSAQKQPSISGTYSGFLSSANQYRFLYPTKFNVLTGYTKNFTTIAQVNVTD
jgi:hypothetical protein